MLKRSKYCCSFKLCVPDGDNRERLVCNVCGHIEYDNPKIVVGLVAIDNGRVLLCKRDINPQKGFWTLPAGFLEHGESPEEGALREASEEANAIAKIETLLSIYSIPEIGLVQLFYRAKLLNKDVSAGEETQAVGLFSKDEIPWSSLAFPSVEWALKHYQEIGSKKQFAPFTNP
tara:strand:+ start:15250 stop:15771 length:522 start_codon:yes stop_codon:yes gene_type:complete